MIRFRNHFQAFLKGVQFTRMNTMSNGPGFLSGLRSIHSMGKPLNFYATPVLCAEPLKKRKKADPIALREKAEKKIHRIQRQIRRLEKVSKKFKPLTELEVPKKILKESQRLRSPPVLSDEEIHRRADIERQWAIYKNRQHQNEMWMINRMIASQEQAMDELKAASPELYKEALQVDPMLIPFHLTGPTRTPPIEGFDYPDGGFIDITKKYLPIVPVEEKKKKGKVNSTKK